MYKLANATTVPAIRKSDLSAIFHKAFTGELTRKWREENEVEENSDALFDRILQYRKNIKAKVNGEIGNDDKGR